MSVKIAFDFMGGDRAPLAQIDGAVRYKQTHPDDQIILVGDEKMFRKHLSEDGQASFELVPTEDFIRMDEKFDHSTLRRRKSSIAVATNLVYCGQAKAVVSCGNTAASVGFAASTLSRLMTPTGNIFPALATTFPSLGQPTLISDLGANPDSHAITLYHLGLMCKVYAEKILGRVEPKIALLSNGTESSKGNELTKEARRLLEKYPFFQGYAEPDDVFAGKFDVVIADGFLGNLSLKWVEATTDFLQSQIKSLTTDNPQPKLIRAIHSKMSYEANNGAVLLGLREGIGLKGHGKSDPEAVASLLGAAFRMIKYDLSSAIEAEFALYPLEL